MSNSFIIEWLVPSALVPQLMVSARKLGFRFYNHERILKVVGGGKQVFPFLPASTPDVTALQVPADMVKDIGADEESHSAAALLQTSMKTVFSQVAMFLYSPVQQVRLIQKRKRVKMIRNELSDASLFSGVGVVYNGFTQGLWRVEQTMSELSFKYIDLYRHIQQGVDLKSLLSIMAQSKAYPTPQDTTEERPFVISFFIMGRRGNYPGSLHSEVDIVDDIIKPFLPQSAPHLTHIPKLFFVSSNFGNKDLDTQPPSFPDVDDANYCLAYHLTQKSANQQEWMNAIAEGLQSASKAHKTVQDVIENLQSLHRKNNERLYYASYLKDKLYVS